MSGKAKYQLFADLDEESFRLLEKDCLERGIQVPIEEDEDGNVLDGHNRLKIADKHGLEIETVTRKFKSEDEKEIHVLMLNMARRHLKPHQWGMAFEMLHERRGARKGPGRPRADDNSVTFTQLCKEVGVNPETAKKRLAAADAYRALPAKERRAVDSGDKSIARAERDVRHEKKTAKHKRSAVNARDSRIIVGDFRERADVVKDKSMSLIFTDPPYNRKALELFDGLGQFAAAKLAVGGSLLVYVGQIQIPQALEILSRHLRYWWVIACVHSGRRTHMREYGIRVGWKAVLWFVRETRHDETVMVNDVMGGGEEKDRHEWQQPVSEAAYWIEKLCPKKGLVCDPFLGSGTTAVAAELVGRPWIGFEIDKETAGNAAERIKTAAG